MRSGICRRDIGKSVGLIGLMALAGAAWGADAVPLSQHRPGLRPPGSRTENPSRSVRQQAPWKDAPKNRVM